MKVVLIAIILLFEGLFLVFSFKHKKMESIEFEDNDGGGIIITPSDGQYDSVIFWFHGLGNSFLSFSSNFSSFFLLFLYLIC